MPQYTNTQLAELRKLSAGMLDTIRRVIRDEPADPQVFLGQLSRLMQGYGMSGVAFAIRAWLDTVVDVYPHTQHGRIDGVAFTNPEGTAFEPPDDISAEYQWAAAALAARLGGDQVALYQLIDGIPPDRASMYLLHAAELVAGIVNDKDGDQAGFLRTGDVVSVTLVDG